MAESSYETSNLNWQVRQSLQRLNEWIEYQFSQIDVDPPQVPHWSWPEAWGRGLFWTLVIGLSLWLSWLFYRGVATYLQRRQGKSLGSLRLAQPRQRSAQEWWRDAHRLAQTGDYRRACRALYMAALQHLHDSQQILHDRSRTDGEYLQVMTGAPARRPYQLLIRTHERSEFGEVPVSAEIYQRCQQAYREIEGS